jgi:hypothetical protein
MTTIPAIDRIRYFAGGLLTAADLTDADTNQQNLRWLHNSTLHDWGIGFGLDVSGAKGGTSVTVTPGYANDIFGRELLLTTALTQPIPAIPGPATYYLVANYLTDAAEPVVQQRDGTACSPAGAVRLANAPAILWKTAAQLTTGTDVILAQITIKNCVLSSPPSGAARKSAVPPNLPAPLAGVIRAADLTWRPWSQNNTAIGFTAAIDTTAASFATTPRYQAQITGSRTLSNPAIIVADFVSITNESPTGFTLQLALPPMSGGVNPAQLTDATTGPALLTALNWQIVWLGIET